MAHEMNDMVPLGGLNWDDSERTIPAGDYVYAKNIRNAVNRYLRGGAATNVKGNTLIQKITAPYTSGSFPAGQNKCIGAVEDIVNRSVIFMVWNSNGNHGIYRYYRDLTDPQNPYGVIEQVISYNFGWTKKTRITSLNIVYGDPDNTSVGDLLYWCDPVPKKINLTKGNICSKKKSWQVLLPVGYEGQPFFFQAIIRNYANNAPVASMNVSIPSGLTLQEMFESFATQLNAGLGSYITAEACGCSLTVTEDYTNAYNFVLSLNNFLVVPDNWYGNTLIDRFFDRCKWQPMQAPQNEYAKDGNYEPNYVDGKVFQFRLQYLYDDNEPSALGVWSQIAINNVQCDGTTDKSYNYIDVDFNDTAILSVQTLVLLKRVRLIARELNTGSDRFVIDLEPCEFLDIDGNSNLIAHYKFYNNIESGAVDADLAAKLFDDVPLESGAEILKNNRLVEGNCLTGYDAPDCANATYTIKIDESQNQKLYNITGKIRVLTYGLAKECAESGGNGWTFENFFPSDKKYPYWKPPFVNNMTRPSTLTGPLQYSGAPLLRGGIFHDISRTDNDFAFFGGGTYDNNGDFGIRSGMEDTFDQRIPERGWPVYAANTQYLTISKQINVGLPQDGLNALDTSSSSKVENIGKYLYNPNEVPFDLYSTFSLQVPNGVYVIRLASHWCSFDDKLDKGFNYDLGNGTQYQKTSTNIWAVIDENGVWKQEKEFTVTVNNGDVYIGEFIVADLAPPHHAEITGEGSTDYWQAINGYLVDDFGATNPNDPDYAGIPVEKTLVSLCGYIFTGAISTPLPVTGITELGLMHSRSAITDHNGYFFQIGGAYVNGDGPPDTNILGYNQMQLTALQSTGKIRSMDTVIGTGTISDYYNKDLDIRNFQGSVSGWGVGLVYGVITTNQTNARLASRTAQGMVIDTNGNGVNAVSVVYENGQVTTTQPNGSYQFIGWLDAKTAYQGNFSLASLAPIKLGYGRTVDDLIFNGLLFCGITYPFGQTYNFSLASSTVPPPNPTVLPDFIIDDSADINGKALKRGGKYVFAVCYYDYAGRSCSFTKLFEVYIPFETEDLGLYPNVVDASGNSYPTGTYRGGKPTVEFALDPNYNPPTWAATYQFGRTPNTIYGRYLQWAVDTVTYIEQVAYGEAPEIITSFANGNATSIKIGLNNLVDYYRTNQDSTLSYSFQEGDRVRLMYTDGITLINGLYDLKVTGYDEATQSIYVKNENIPFEIKRGFLIEVFNPKFLTDNEFQIIYEVGEVYNCTAPYTPNNQHSVTSGAFTNGDTYWHGRLIPVTDDNTNFASTYPVVIESASVSDFYSSEASDIGRVGVIDANFKQIRRPMLLKVSNQYIPSTAVNGLSNFEALNEKELDRSNGAIQRLVSINQTIVAVSNVRETSNYIQVVTFQQATQGQGVLAVADQYFGTDYPHSKTLGTNFPQSVFINDGILFGIHTGRGESWRYQGDGEVSISDVKMKSYFDGLRRDGVSDIVAVYDRYHEQYIATIYRNYTFESEIITGTKQVGGGYIYTALFPYSTNLPPIQSDITFQYYANGKWHSIDGTVTGITQSGGNYYVSIYVAYDSALRAATPIKITYSIPETIGWYNGNDADRMQRWKTFYDFTPEYYAQMGNEIVMFKDGHVWLADTNPVYNNFFGQQYQTQLTPVFNEQPTLNKVWNALWLKGTQEDGNCVWRADSVNNEYGQLSRLNKNNWRKKENNFFIDMKRDTTDVTVTDPIINGRRMRSEALKVEMQNDYTGEIVLYGLRMNYTLSERTIK